jgi:hypothetical protein
MMKLLTNLPDYVVSVCVSGEIDAKDYATILIPAIDSALHKHNKIRMLYQLTPEFTGFTSAAMWDDVKIGLAHWKAWEKVAVVTDVLWVANATRMFAFMMPGPVKVFSNSEQSAAEKWIAA